MSPAVPIARALLAAIAVAASLSATAQVPADGGRAQLHTNQIYIEDANRETSLPISDPKAMFAIVLGSLPDRVEVYPTENYYYFRFFDNGMPYAGNIRLDAKLRDEGKVHFAYFPEWAGWLRNNPDLTYVILGRDEGVTVERLTRFHYQVSIGSKRVTFELNDLSHVKPPPEILGPDEKFIGPVFDESGIRFFLLFNSKRRMFHFVLDETVPLADQLVPGRLTDRILIGTRTGFAFYRDHYFDRRILIGSYLANTLVNNYLDGPFDQLPDNFIEGDELRDAILQVDPSLAGRIDRFGNFLDAQARYLVNAYIEYRFEEELLYMHNCAELKELPFEWYHACLVGDGSGFADYPQPPHDSSAPSDGVPDAGEKNE
jgi:hypothetical protein